MIREFQKKKSELVQKLTSNESYKEFDEKVLVKLSKASLWVKKQKGLSLFLKTILWLAEMLVITLIGIFISFFIINSVPAEPPFLTGLSEGQKQVVEAQYGLDQSLIEQFGSFLGNIFTKGDLGISYAVQPEKPINSFLWDRMGVSLTINMLSILVGIFFGMILGLVLGQKPGGLLDSATGVMISIIYASPSILIAMYILLIGRGIGIEYVFNQSNPESYVLPVISLSVFSIASYIRFIRAELSDQLKSQHAKFAALKDVSKTRFLFRHALKPAIFPVATFLPEALLTSFIGSFIVERVFTIPGTGSLILEAINTSDTNVVLSIFIITTLMSVLAFRLRDILYRLIDPRIRRGG